MKYSEEMEAEGSVRGGGLCSWKAALISITPSSFPALLFTNAVFLQEENTFITIGRESPIYSNII